MWCTSRRSQCGRGQGVSLFFFLLLNIKAGVCFCRHCQEFSELRVTGIAGFRKSGSEEQTLFAPDAPDSSQPSLHLRQALCVCVCIGCCFSFTTKHINFWYIFKNTDKAVPSAHFCQLQMHLVTDEAAQQRQTFTCRRTHTELHCPAECESSFTKQFYSVVFVLILRSACYQSSLPYSSLQWGVTIIHISSSQHVSNNRHGFPQHL